MALDMNSSSRQRATRRHSNKLSSYSEKRRKNRSESEPSYNEENQEKQRLSIRIDEVFSDKTGRIMQINNPKEPNYYFLVHTWNNQEHTSFRIEPRRFASQAEAQEYLQQLTETKV